MKLKTAIIIFISIFVSVFVGLANTEDLYKGFFATLNLNNLNGKNGFKLNLNADTVPSSCTKVRGAGDINGDGFADILVGNSASMPGKNGLMYVVFGSRESWPGVINLSELNGKNGFAVAINNNLIDGDFSGAGDVNDDGTDDFLISFSNSNNNHGQIYVVFGSKKQWPQTVYLSNLNGNDGFGINGTGAAFRSGFSVSNAGDINHDGVVDVLIGALKKSYVVFGGKGPWPSEIYLTNLNGSNGFVINQIESENNNRVVSGAGDINADGIDDIIIGSTYDWPKVQQNFLIFGSKGPWPKAISVLELDGKNGVTMNDDDSKELARSIVSRAGDFNNDGIDDIVIGGYRRTSYVVFGRNNSWPATINISNLNGSDGFIINSIDIGVNFRVVSGVGDVNGDNVSDILLSTPYVPFNVGIGQCYIIFGSNRSWPRAINLVDLNGINGFVIDGQAARDQSGCSVSGVGDVNGDGLDDFLIGANRVQGYVVFGAYERASPFLKPLLFGLFGGISGVALGVGGYYTYQYYRHNDYVIIPDRNIRMNDPVKDWYIKSTDYKTNYP